MNERELFRIARAVLKHGKAFNRGWHDDGDAENGPRGGAIPTIRWGGVELSISTNGSCYLATACGRWDMAGFYLIFGTHWGSGHWGGGEGKLFWVDRARQQIRDEVVRRCKETVHFASQNSLGDLKS